MPATQDWCVAGPSPLLVPELQRPGKTETLRPPNRISSLQIAEMWRQTPAIFQPLFSLKPKQQGTPVCARSYSSGFNVG